MYVLVFYVPEADAEKVKTALFEAGAGRIGNYDNCSWQVSGKGQFRPLAGSRPYIGNKNIIEYIDEFRIEMVCSKEVIENVLQALLRHHPYEEPAYHVIENISDRFKISQ